MNDTKIDAFFRKWLARLPHPYSAKNRKAGYRYDLSVLQAEFSLTQISDRAVHGRCFFEEVMHDALVLLSRRNDGPPFVDGRGQRLFSI